MKVVWVEGHKYIDNGIFFDGRRKTLDSTDTGQKSTGSVKEERLRKDAMGCKPIDKYTTK